MKPDPHPHSHDAVRGARRRVSPARVLRLAALALATGSSLSQVRADAQNTADVVAAANTFLAPLGTSQKTFIDASSTATLNSSCLYNFTLANVEVWSNLPTGGTTRNGLQFSALSTANQTNALAVASTALSTTGRKLLDDVRAADRYISGEVKNAKNSTSSMWGYNKYFISFIGTPSTTAPWTFQFGGHHLAYNITYNGAYTSGTPIFAGNEPNSWTDTTGTYAPLGAQRTLLESLRSSLSTSAQLTGTFSDVVFGPNGTGNHDTVQPKAYPTSGRGQLYSALTSAQQAQVRAYIESWVNLLHPSIANELLPIYESPQALAETYVGYAGSNTLMRAANNYFRVDGPRLWIEFSVQGGVYDSSSYHDHGVARDKLADYGGAYGAATLATTLRPPAISTQPASQSISSGGSATFSVTAASTGTGTATLSYQWYKDGTAVSGATAASYTIAPATAADAGSYTVQVVSTGGLTTSSAATLTLAAADPVTISTAAALPGGVVGAAYSQTLTASGGTQPYTWAVTTGTLPAGLALTAAGVVQGAPGAGGSFAFTAQATDSASRTAAKDFTLTVAEPADLYLAAHSLPAGSWEVDSDGDGIPNLLEFLFDGDPAAGDATVLPTVSYDASSSTLGYAFEVVANPGTATWKVQTSADLTTWTDAVNGADGITLLTTTGTDGLVHVTVQATATAAHQFLRVAATPPTE